jgi:hypothetical protein
MMGMDDVVVMLQSLQRYGLHLVLHHVFAHWQVCTVQLASSQKVEHKMILYTRTVMAVPLLPSIATHDARCSFSTTLPHDNAAHCITSFQAKYSSL